MAALESMPSSHLVFVAEKFTHLLNLGNDSDVLYLALAYGFLDQICRTKHQISAITYKNKINEAAASAPNFTKSFDWLKGQIDIASRERLSTSDLLAQFQDKDAKEILKDFIKQFTISKNLHKENYCEELIAGRLSTRDDITTFQTICANLKFEVGIYFLHGDERYERIEYFTGDSQGLSVHIYQIQQDTGQQTGLLFHEEMIKADTGIPTNLRKYPFTCKAGPSPMRKKDIDWMTFEPRYSNDDKTIPDLSRFSKGQYDHPKKTSVTPSVQEQSVYSIQAPLIADPAIVDARLAHSIPPTGTPVSITSQPYVTDQTASDPIINRPPTSQNPIFSLAPQARGIAGVSPPIPPQDPVTLHVGYEPQRSTADPLVITYSRVQSSKHTNPPHAPSGAHSHQKPLQLTATSSSVSHHPRPLLPPHYLPANPPSSLPTSVPSQPGPLHADLSKIPPPHSNPLQSPLLPTGEPSHPKQFQVSSNSSSASSHPRPMQPPTSSNVSAGLVPLQPSGHILPGIPSHRVRPPAPTGAPHARPSAPIGAPHVIAPAPTGAPHARLPAPIGAPHVKAPATGAPHVPPPIGAPQALPSEAKPQSKYINVNPTQPSRSQHPTINPRDTSQLLQFQSMPELRQKKLEQEPLKPQESFAPKPPEQPSPAQINEEDYEVCGVCKILKQKDMIYQEVRCPASCSVCVECMHSQGIPTKTCPQCKFRTLSNFETQLIEILKQSIAS